jgi:hypothetical protein
MGPKRAATYCNQGMWQFLYDNELSTTTPLATPLFGKLAYS